MHVCIQVVYLDRFVISFQIYDATKTLIEDCDVCMHMSCQCFAKMLIHFYFGKFLALWICSIFSKGHAEILFESDGSLTGKS